MKPNRVRVLATHEICSFASYVQGYCPLNNLALWTIDTMAKQGFRTGWVSNIQEISRKHYRPVYCYDDSSKDLMSITTVSISFYFLFRFILWLPWSFHAIITNQIISYCHQAWLLLFPISMHYVVTSWDHKLIVISLLDKQRPVQEDVIFRYSNRDGFTVPVYL